MQPYRKRAVMKPYLKIQLRVNTKACRLTRFLIPLKWNNMLDFKKVEIGDIKKIQRFTYDNSILACEKTAVNLMVWQKAYNNMFAIADDMLFLKSGKEKSQSFGLPFCQDLKKGLELIFEYTAPELPRFWLQNDGKIAEFKEIFGESYDISPIRDAFDYIYSREKLADLSGKKYHSKRNHISTFKKQYNWHFEMITAQNKKAVFECSEKWYEENADRMDEYMAIEREGIKIILDNMSYLKVMGGAIYVDDKIVAFTLGSPINDKAFDIHIEKALKDYATAYTVINNEFAKALTNYELINREDDMGLEGLRKAKLSYKPEVLLEKYRCRPIKEACIRLYDNAFHDGPFTLKLFDLCYDYIKTLRVDCETVAMCFLLPCEIDGKKAKYIYGFTVKEKHRGKGYGKALMEQIKNETKDILILRPANEKLIDYYKQFNFCEVKASNEKGNIACVPFDNFARLCEKDKKGEYTAMVYGFNTDKTLYFPYSLA